ncbi:transcriptional enhancer factor TEF-4 isoform X2 [Alligator mississippiensis]|uniref:transcriptional enhancer factor TEF-4 isoform X2 n=1 Tax=Alligator mississippiensis TaxID=8496 RepID=UPI000906FF95|nr:transcriptional enhancer factor TEF-4 isoform X2 [Alligator mississippiensis]
MRARCTVSARHLGPLPPQPDTWVLYSSCPDAQVPARHLGSVTAHLGPILTLLRSHAAWTLYHRAWMPGSHTSYLSWSPYPDASVPSTLGAMLHHPLSGFPYPEPEIQGIILSPLAWPQGPILPFPTELGESTPCRSPATPSARLSVSLSLSGRNELIARYIKLRTGKTRTRKQVSSHIQVLARRKSREIQSKVKAMNVDQVSKDKALQSIAAMSSAQLVSATGLQDKLGVPSFTHRSFPPSPGSPEFFQFWPGDADQTRPNQDVKPYPVPPAAASLAVPGFEVPMPPVPSPAVWPGHCIGSPHLCLVEFSVFVELPAEPETFKQHLFVHIGSSPPHPADPPLEAVDVRQIYDKFPEKTGGLRDLYEQGPSNAFFLVKFWADLSAPLPTEPGAFYGVSSKYEGPEPLAITCAHKVCSFGKQVVERVETELGHLEDGRYVFRLLRFPLCEYLVNFVHKLQQLPEKYMMDSVLENFTVLQVVRNRDSQELLLCMAFVFEVSANKRGAQHHVYRLVKD